MVSGTIFTDSDQDHYKRFDTYLAGVPHGHSFLDCNAEESLNEFEEEERFEETEKNSKKISPHKTWGYSGQTAGISNSFSTTFRIYRQSNTIIQFSNHSINAHAPPSIS